MTKSTGNSKQELTSQQETALDLLATGETICATAKKVRCAEKTLREWIAYDFEFYFAFEGRRAEAFQLNGLRLRSLLPTAIDVLEKNLKGRNAIQAAAQILSLAGMQNAPSPLNTDDLPILKECRRVRDQARRANIERAHRRFERTKEK